MKPPVECVRAHLPASDPRCDTVTVLNMAARRRPGHRYADMNAVAGATTDWNLHFPDGPEANHFTHQVNPATGKIERMPPRLRHLPVDQWQDDKSILGWRKNIGTEAKPKWVRPFTVAQRQGQAKRRLVYGTWELKSRTYGQKNMAERFVKAVSRAGGRWCVMTLVLMRGWAEKLTAFHNAGAGTALLAHNAPRPANLSSYYPSVIDRIWGHFS